MTTGTGIDAQLGFAEESTYGTFVAPTRFFEFLSAAIKADVGKIYGQGLGRGRVERSDRMATYVKGAAGSIELEVQTKGFGFFFKHMLGAVATAQPDAAGNPTVYKQTHTLDPDALRGKSLTVQVGLPSTNGTVNPFNYPGTKILSWELVAALDEALKLKLNVDAKTEERTSPLASKSFPAGASLLTFVNGALTIGGASVDVDEVTLAGDNGLNAGRRGLGNTKREQLGGGRAMLTGNLTKDFENTTLYADFISGATAQLVLTFTGPTITGTYPYLLKVTLPAITYTGETPSVEGPDVVKQGVPFKVLDNGTNQPITLEYQTTDTTP